MNQASSDIPARIKGFAGVMLAADMAGPPAGRPVIFLHGGGQTRHSWRAAAAALAQRGYYAISLDLRGHGESGWAPDGDYSIGAYAADLQAVIHGLARRPAVVGASLGGLTALLAIGQSETPNADALIMVDVVPQMEMQGVTRIHSFMLANAGGFANVEEAADAVATYLPHRPRPTNVSGLRKNLREGADKRLYWHWDPEMVLQRRPATPDLLALLETAARRISIPTLLIRGEHSDIVSEDGVKAFQALIPHSEYVDVKDARHMLVGDENNAFNGALLEFLLRQIPPQ